MPNYQNGKIYKIESLIGGCVYYGSTTKKYLCDRLSGHNYNYKKNNTLTSGYVLQYPDAKIELVELYPCNTKDELHAREGYYIKNNVCVNKCIAGRTKKEWYDDNCEKMKNKMNEYYNDNKQKMNKQSKQYSIDNKEKIKERCAKQKICECGSIYTQYNYKRHFKTKYHLKYIDNPFFRLAI